MPRPRAHNSAPVSVPHGNTPAPTGGIFISGNFYLKFHYRFYIIIIHGKYCVGHDNPSISVREDDKTPTTFGWRAWNILNNARNSNRLLSNSNHQIALVVYILPACNMGGSNHKSAKNLCNINNYGNIFDDSAIGCAR